MAYFDFLNTPAKAPDPVTRYWYDFHMAWDPALPFMESKVDIQRGRVVHRLNLEHPQSGYTFEFVDEPGKEYHCNYTWAFVRCSLDNWWRRKVRDMLQTWMAVLEKMKARLTNDFDSLKKNEPHAHHLHPLPGDPQRAAPAGVGAGERQGYVLPQNGVP